MYLKVFCEMKKYKVSKIEIVILILTKLRYCVVFVSYCPLLIALAIRWENSLKLNGKN